jgi:hypothetical protein
MIRQLLRTTAVMALVAPMMAFANTYTDSTPYQVEAKYPYVVYPSSFQMDNNYSWETPNYYFDPSVYYFAYEREMIVQDELAVTAGSLSTDSDGSAIININQGSIPEATQQNVPPPVEQMPGNDGMTTQSGDYNKSYSRTQRFGNNIFGAGYAINANITATNATATAPKRVDAFAEGKVFATAFNREQEIVRGRAEVHGQEGGANSGNAALFAMGQQIWSTNLYKTFAPTPIDWSRTFFSISKTFMVGPVPISVTASLAGGVKLTVTGEVGPTVARLTATPGGWSRATASASVNIIVASFGVSGNLTLINTSMPSKGELFWPYCTLNWTLKSNLQLNTLSGYLDLFAKIKFLFFSKTWTVNIARWSGLTYNWELVNVNGTKDLGICMFMGPTAEEPLYTAEAQ